MGKQILVQLMRAIPFEILRWADCKPKIKMNSGAFRSKIKCDPSNREKFQGAESKTNNGRLDAIVVIPCMKESDLDL